MLQLLLRSLALSSLSHATKIYVSSYSGNITAVSVTPGTNGGNLTLTAISSNNGCSPNPSWLELDKSTEHLYCADEGLNTPMANFASFQTSQNGSLTLLDKIVTLNGGVYSKIYENESSLALANYGGSGITIVNISRPHLEVLQEQLFEFETNETNPKTNQPVQPYIHQTIIDPTGTFLLAPDLSADLIHVFSISSSHTLQHLPNQVDISVPKGHGPRHGVFYQPGNNGSWTYLYVVMETANMVHAYKVTYNSDNTLNFNLTQYLQLPVPTTAAAAEIQLTPDNKYLIISSRSDNSFTILNPDPTNNTHIPSDSLFTYLISPPNGQISLVQAFPAGGLLPRQFELNKNGTLLAVALNGDNRLVVIGRDVTSGNMSSILGSLDIDVEGKGPGMVTCAIWHEDYHHKIWEGSWNSSATNHTGSHHSQTGKATATVALTAGSTTATGAAMMTGSSTASGATISTPTPFKAGMVANCTSFYWVVANDTCSGIATTQGISLSDFYSWNPAVDSSCRSLDVGNNVCIGLRTYD